MSEALKVLSPKIRRALDQVPQIVRALALVWSAARRWTGLWLSLLILQGLLPVGLVYLTKYIVNSLIPAINSGGAWQDVRPTMLFILAFALLALLMEGLRSATSWVETVQSELLRDHITNLIHEKSIEADIAFYELPDYYDHLHRAREEASYRPVALLKSGGSLLQSTVTLVAMSAVLLTFGFWLPLALFLSTLPAFYVVLNYTLKHHQWRLRTTADERRTWYYDQVLTHGDNAGELRLFALGDYFKSKYRRLRERLMGERIQLAKDQGVAEFLAGTIFLVITGLALAWMVWQTARGAVTLGDLALFYAAFNQGQRLMRTLLDNVGQLYANSLYLGNLFEFLGLRPTVVSPPQTAQMGVSGCSISFRNVSFSYPGSDRLALDDFDLEIPAGKITAIVGQNGAGKSTLIKLLCRFYDPDRGRIEIDGVDIRELSIDELRSRLTVLFQQAVHYNASAADNIALGDITSPPNLDEIKSAAVAAGADEAIAHLPSGYDSLLGKWFEGGTELSVGEWQRIALARAFLREAPIIILDEPTSAMDPWAENEWLKRFQELARGRTALIITHRFTTALRADIIHVISGGKIIESGKHHDLLLSSGVYAEAWAAQVR